GPAERAAVERHLAACEACRAEVALLRLVAQSLQQVAPAGPSQAMRHRLGTRVAAGPAPRQMDVLWSGRHGQQRTPSHEIRPDPATPARALPSTGLPLVAGRSILQYRSESISASGRRCVMAHDYDRSG